MTEYAKKLLRLYHEQSKKNRIIEGSLPLNFKGKGKDLKNYRIYGNTVNGESVGDRTANLFDKDDPDILDGYEIRETNIVVRQSYFVTNFISVNAETSYITNDVNIGGFSSGILEYDSSKQLIRKNPNSSFNGFTTTNTTAYIKLNGKIEGKDTCMLVKGNTVPSIYEPYGYRVPVTVTNGTDTQTTNLYLPEPIKMVGDEAEYIDYGEQKLHRVRKNLLQNIAASKTISGVTFTVNADGSVTCNGTNTANSAISFNISTYLLIGTYIINGSPKNGSLETYSVDLRDPSNWNVLGKRDTGLGFTFTNNTVRTVYYVIRINPGYTCDNLTFYPMIRKADIEDDTYEPYIENTDLDVTLPALPTISGTNTLSVGTEVQPSKVEIKGKIKAVQEGSGENEGE